jgi:RNA polymerase sigma-54 factor
MIQSLTLLQMPIAELSLECSKILEENPVLETDDFDLDADGGDEKTGDAEETEETLLDNLSSPEWDNYIGDGNSNELAFLPQPSDDDSDYEDYISAEESLAEHLLNQLRTENLNAKQIEIGEMIIGNLTEAGYFLVDLSEIAESCFCTEEEVSEVLSVIKTFDPAGIASETLTECILAQLPDLDVSEGEQEQIREILLKYSKELESYKYDEIVRKTGLDRGSLNEMLEIMRRTDPKPGLKFSPDRNKAIIPDAYIVRSGDEFDVRLNETGLPPMRLNRYYLMNVKSPELDENTRKYIAEKLKSAIWILKSLHRRQSVLYRVTKAIVDVQKDYLSRGEKYFKPLRLKDVADITELSESAVSRATAGKYVLTDQGMLELKSFFSKKLDTSEGDTSSRSVKTQIRTLLDGEPVAAPFSDDKLTHLLNNMGIDIARRTVAKYREEMKIPKKAERKRMKQ